MARKRVKPGSQTLPGAKNSLGYRTWIEQSAADLVGSGKDPEPALWDLIGPEVPGRFFETANGIAGREVLRDWLRAIYGVGVPQDSGGVRRKPHDQWNQSELRLFIVGNATRRWNDGATEWATVQAVATRLKLDAEAEYTACGVALPEAAGS